MLAVVGAVVMLVVASSLARVFRIVGVARMIRYSAKIDDPKDAVAMLATAGLNPESPSVVFLINTHAD